MTALLVALALLVVPEASEADSPAEAISAHAGAVWRAYAG